MWHSCPGLHFTRAAEGSWGSFAALMVGPTQTPEGDTMQHINTRLVTSTFLWNFTFLVKTTTTGGEFPWMKSQEWMSKNMNHDCPEPPTSPSGVALSGTGIPAKPKLLTKTHMRHQAQGNCMKRHLFSWQSPSATHRSLSPSALMPGAPPPPWCLAHLGQWSCRCAVPGATAPAGGCRGPLTAFTQKRWREGM